MKKVILLFLLSVIGITVSCEKSDWFSPEDVDSIKASYQTYINDLTDAKNELTTQVTDLTTQVTNLTTEVEELEASVSTLTESNTTLIAENATVQTLTDNVATLTAQLATLTSEKDDLDAQIVTLTTSNTTLTTSNTTLTDQVTTLTASVTALQLEITDLETEATVLEGQITSLKDEVLTFQNFKLLREKLDTMVAATITDTNLNAAIDSISIGLTSSSVSATVLKGLISTEADWLFDNAIKTGTTSMTTAVSTFYDTSTDTNVINFRTLVGELTTAWNTAKESTLITWFIEFIKEYENL
jgi:predicted RNase H-like nuclease (RuvC/YqgF family)